MIIGQSMKSLILVFLYCLIIINLQGLTRNYGVGEHVLQYITISWMKRNSL